MLTLDVKAFDPNVPETYPTREGACLGILAFPNHDPDKDPPVQTGYVWRRVIWETDGKTGKFHLLTRTPPKIHGWEVVGYVELPDPEEYPWLETDVYPPQEEKPWSSWAGSGYGG